MNAPMYRYFLFLFIIVLAVRGVFSIQLVTTAMGLNALVHDNKHYVVYGFTVSYSASYTFQTTDMMAGNYDTILSIYSPNFDPADFQANLVATNDNNGASKYSLLKTPLELAKKYYLVLEMKDVLTSSSPSGEIMTYISNDNDYKVTFDGGAITSFETTLSSSSPFLSNSDSPYKLQAFTVASSGIYEIRTGDQTNTNQDTQLYLFENECDVNDLADNRIDYNDNNYEGNSKYSKISAVLETGKTYFVLVSANGGGFRTTATMTFTTYIKPIEIGAAAATLISAPKPQSYYTYIGLNALVHNGKSYLIWGFTVSSSAYYTVQTVQKTSIADTILSIYTSDFETVNFQATTVATNDDKNVDSTFSKITTRLEPSTKYYLIIMIKDVLSDNDRSRFFMTEVSNGITFEAGIITSFDTTLSSSSPFLPTSTGQSEPRPYRLQTFTAAISGIYEISTDANTGAYQNTELYLFENECDINDLNSNLIAYNDDNFEETSYSKIFAELSTGKTYVILVTGIDADFQVKTITFTTYIKAIPIGAPAATLTGSGGNGGGGDGDDEPAYLSFESTITTSSPRLSYWYYAKQGFTVSASAIYLFEANTNTRPLNMRLIENSFNEDDLSSNVVVDARGTELTFPLTAGTNYYLLTYLYPVGDTPAEVTTTITGPAGATITAITSTTLNSDPIVTGFDGRVFDFKGAPNRIFNMFSMSDLQVNSYFIPANLPGETYTGAVGIQQGGVTHILFDLNSAYIYSENATAAGLREIIKTISFPMKSSLQLPNGGFVTRPSPGRLVVEWPLYSIEMKRIWEKPAGGAQFEYIDMTLTLKISSLSKSEVNGVLGQTFQHANLTSYYDGTWTDYVAPEGTTDMFTSHFPSKYFKYDPLSNVLHTQGDAQSAKSK